MTRRIVDPGELPEVKDLLGLLAEAGPPHPERDADEPSPHWDFPAYRTHFFCPGPQVLVRNPDGIYVEFRPGWDGRARAPHVHGTGVLVRGVKLDIQVMLGDDLGWSSGWISLSDARGTDYGEPADAVPARVRDAAVALCRRRAKEAREALGVVTGQRKPPATTTTEETAVTATLPDPAELARYAGQIMAAIHADMDAGLVPRDVGSFSALHDHRDANMYVLIAMGEVDTYTAEGETDEHHALVNAIMDEVDRRLAAEAAAITAPPVWVVVDFDDAEAAAAARINSVAVHVGAKPDVDEETQQVYPADPPA